MVDQQKPEKPKKIQQYKNQTSYVRHQKMTALLDKFGCVIPKLDKEEKLDDYEIKELYDLATLGCSKQEIAGMFFISLQRLNFIMEKDPRARKAFEFGRTKNIVLLRKKLYFAAYRQNNYHVLLFLAKNVLGMVDKERIINVNNNIENVSQKWDAEAVKSLVQQLRDAGWGPKSKYEFVDQKREARAILEVSNPSKTLGLPNGPLDIQSSNLDNEPTDDLT